MIKHTCITTIIILLVTTSCKTNKITNDTLVGEWISTDNNKICFSFGPRRCTYLRPFGNFAFYKVIDSNLIITDTIKSRSKVKHEELKFKILKVKNDMLILSPDQATLKNYLNRRLNTISLRRIKSVHKTDFQIIEFESSGCFGSCPVMKLSINKKGKIIFEGRSYAEKKGYYSGQLSELQMERIRRKINLLDLESLKENYAAGWTDDETTNISIKTKHKTYKSEVYGSDQEPKALRFIIHDLKEIYKYVDMKKDSSHHYSYYDIFVD